MRERPILFSAPMVRAILAGRKTQTRRAVKNTGLYAIDAAIHGEDVARRELAALATRCPYGQPGDVLWVKETWQGPLLGEGVPAPEDAYSPKYCEYRADGGPAPEFMTSDDVLVRRWRPSIHMPRWASRIILEVTAVRVERLQDISDRGPQNDCTAEGVFHCGMDVPSYEAWSTSGLRSSEKYMYRQLWESINGAGSWDANPWVWVVEFRMLDHA
jgi:hypothetical protein